MPILKAPLFSLAAKGTLADTLTYTDSPSGPRVQQIPTHPDALTLPQHYQRWKFRDAQFAWLSLSAAQRAAFQALRYPPHMTGQQRHTRQWLKALTDLALWLPLDELTGQTLHDISRHLNHTTAIGTSSLPGVIAASRHFDAVDDRLTLPITTSLAIRGPFTFSLWLNRHASGAHQYLLVRWPGPNKSFLLHFTPAHNLTLRLSTTGLNEWAYSTLDTFPALNTWIHFAVSFDPDTRVAIYHNGSLSREWLAGIPGLLYAPNTSITVAGPGQFYHGLIDDLRIYTRALTPAHIAYIHQQERYPPPN